MGKLRRTLQHHFSAKAPTFAGFQWGPHASDIFAHQDPSSTSGKRPLQRPSTLVESELLAMKIPLVYGTGAVLYWACLSSAEACSHLLDEDIPGTRIATAESTVLTSSTRNDSYCRVTGSVAYGECNNSVRFELWMPSGDAYNGRFMVVGECDIYKNIKTVTEFSWISGNGGLAGTIDTAQMTIELEQGYAVAGYFDILR